MRTSVAGGTIFLTAVLALYSLGFGASAGDVVINEVWVNDAHTFDSGEYIELYNRTASPIDLGKWVLDGTEYDGTCGEHHWQMPTGITIPAYGYIVIARDAQSENEVVNPGFTGTWGFKPTVEMFDPLMYFEIDDVTVPNMVCQNPDIGTPHDTQIRLIPGTSDYSKSCSGSYNRYEVLYLYADSSRTQLIDAMEYRDPAYCAADQCLGINVSDNDAFVGIPDPGISLGRDGSGTDTNNSLADFYLEVATPKAQNSINVPPDIWTLRYSPCAPKASNTVTISCYAKDPDGIFSAKCYYSVNGGAYSNTAMSAAPGDSLYSCVLPAQSDGSQITFYVEATDNNPVKATSRYPADAPAGAYRYSVGMTLISSVQYVDIGGDSSSYAGKAVNITGIVTAGRGLYNDYIFVIQDGSGAWNGIWVFDPTASVPAEEGDSVIVSGKVNEYFLQTELYMFVGCYNEISAGHALPAPVTVATSALATTSTLAERYEGVLTKVQNVTVTNDSLGFGEWEVNDGSGACRIGDYAYYTYVPNTGDHLDGIQGILNYAYNYYMLDPRYSEDILGPPMVSDLVYAPHAPGASDLVTFSVTVKGTHPPFTVKLFTSANGGASFDSTGMTTLDSVYTAVKGPWPNGTTLLYYVRVTDTQPMIARKPAAGTYDLYVGMVTIHQIQYVVAPADSSPYAGKPVNVSGVVTAASGEFSNNFFYIQNHYGAVPDFKGVKVYDRTGTVSVARGDSVIVSGDVWEYYLNTEIAMFFPEAITIVAHGKDVPAAYSVTTAGVNASEKYEGVLVVANAATVKGVADSYGEWLISNGGAADTCKVGDAGTYAYVPALNDNVIVKGVVDYTYSQYKIQPRNDDDICSPGEAGVDGPGKSTKIAMMVRPNPMLDGGEIRFALPASGRVELKIYNVKGELVKTLLEGTVEAGDYKIDWNGTNTRDSKVTAGIYFMRLHTGSGSAVSKVVVSR